MWTNIKNSGGSDEYVVSKIVMYCMAYIVRDVVEQKEMWVNIKNSVGVVVAEST